MRGAAARAAGGRNRTKTKGLPLVGGGGGALIMIPYSEIMIHICNTFV